jgi:hypothetical protein
MVYPPHDDLLQVIDSRLKAIEQRVFPERFSQQGQS